MGSKAERRAFGVPKMQTKARRREALRGKRQRRRFLAAKKGGRRNRDIFHEEDGFSTLGMVVALLVTLSLIFSAAQVYRVHSASADIQNVADAAALAAENEVAEFMVVARVCDAVVLSLSLTGLTAYGLGIVALCVPGGASAGEKLLELGGKIMDARDAFAKKASAGLSSLQKALPFLAAANAASVASSNNGGPMRAQYVALAVLVPFAGSEVSIEEVEGSQDLKDEAEEKSGDLKRAAEEAEEAAKEANEAKMRGFMADCGCNPSYCLYERAFSLARMDGAENPFYSSVDTWSFSVPLKRAQSYYAQRLKAEIPENASVEEGARSALRKRFYQFAVTELSSGYVHEDGTSFEAYFPALPKNADEMRETLLYTDACYPATEGEGGSLSLHAWEGCPNARSVMAYASIAQMEAGGYETCAACSFTAQSLGKVAAASTSVDNGFEYHYAAVAQAAREYERARAGADSSAASVKDQAQSLLDQCAQALRSAGGQRIGVAPPGRYGAIALVANVASAPASTGFESSFVRDGGVLGTRAAVSAATLVEDSSDEGETVITSILDGFAEDGGAVVGAARVVLDCWSGLLRSYSDGQQALEDAIVQSARSLPLASASGLGDWAAETFESCAGSLGLQPAKLDALRPVTVNTEHVASTDDEGFSVRFLAVKRAALAATDPSALFSSVLEKVGGVALSRLSEGGGTLEIATIEFPVGGFSVPVTITLPPSVTEAADGLVNWVIDGLQSVGSSLSGTRVWE